MKTENWNGHNIRFVEHNGEWWAVAQDVTNALGFRDATVATQKMLPKYKGTAKVCTPSGEQTMIILNEKGLYRLIMRSNKPEAEAFQDWVYEVLKKLREAAGLEGFEIFRVLDKEHQREMMAHLRNGLKEPKRVDFIKANTIANKAISTRHGYPKMLRKKNMTPQMLQARQAVLEDTVELMEVNEKYELGLSISDQIYRKHAN